MSDAVSRGVLFHWELLLAMRHSQKVCSWEAKEEVPENVRKTRAYADWHPLLTNDSLPPALSTVERQQFSLDNLPASLATPVQLQPLLSRAAHWQEKRDLDIACTGAYKAGLFTLGSTWSGLWLRLVPSQAWHGMASAIFRCAV